tara:strand:- start:348 stop:611 length:264 start_codon:yes stop_codon:yes gene_type:complete
MTWGCEMKLSFELSKTGKELLLELLKDPEIRNEILDIAGPPEISENLDELIEQKLEEKTNIFVVEDQLDSSIQDALRNATFYTECEG